MKKCFVIDTNVLLNDPYCLAKFEENDVIIPLTVLEELDKQKSSDRDIARDARAVLREIDEVVRGEDTLVEGAPTQSGGKLFVKRDTVIEEGNPKRFIEPTCNDDKIINVAYEMQLEGVYDEVVLVSNDINMRIKAQGVGVTDVQEFHGNNHIEDPDLLPTGYIQLPEKWLETLDNKVDIIAKSCGETHISTDKFQELLEELEHEGNFGINDWIFNEDDGVVAQFVDIKVDDKDKEFMIFDFHNLDQLYARKAAGIKPKNIHQALGFNSLLNPEIDIVFLTAEAGTGKTLSALATACEMVKGKKSYRMDEIIFTRTEDSQFNDIGFLKGNEANKMAPWLAGASDNLEIIARESKQKKFHPSESVDMEEGKEEAFVKYKSLKFMRGRSISHKVLIVDESQNLTAAQMKTILTRAGEYCKVIIMGNLGQIDNDYVSPRTSGLTYAIEKYHGVPFAQVIHLGGGVVRSRIAEHAEKTM